MLYAIPLLVLRAAQIDNPIKPINLNHLIFGLKLSLCLQMLRKTNCSSLRNSKICSWPTFFFSLVDLFLVLVKSTAFLNHDSLIEIFIIIYYFEIDPYPFYVLMHQKALYLGKPASRLGLLL